MEAAAAGAAREAAGGGMEQRTGEAQMDAYLASQGLYRKRIAKDGSCLFRAVSEQVLHSQARHYDIRIACINYLRKNRATFEAFIEGPFEDYLKRLENPQEWVGQVEISALSLIYKKDFVIYQEPNAQPSCVTENQFPDKIMLCFSNGNHYDIVYPATYAENAAFCQSILYEMLYEKVLSTNVSKILSGLENHDRTRAESGGSDDDSEAESDDASKSKNPSTGNMIGFKSPPANKQLHSNENPAYFSLPRKVLQSLNPAHYRNVEYEVWLKLKRDQQKHDFSIAAGMQYSVGDKCKVRLEPNGKFYDAHIQEVSSESGPVVVYVEEFGKKHKVPLKSLKPLLHSAPHSTPREPWNTVSGKKIKRSPYASGAPFQPEAEYRGQKNAGKPVKPQSSLPPRLQQAAGNRQQHYSSSSVPASQHIPIEHRTQNRTPAQTINRKLERERSEEFDHSSKECNYFGLSPEERREKQAIEESRSLYEIQNMDEQAFPALSSPTTTQSIEVHHQRKPLNVNNDRSPKQKVDLEDRKESSVDINHSDLSVQVITSETREECPKASSSPAPPSSIVTPCVIPAPPEVLPDLPMLPAVPPVEPLISDTVPAWPAEAAAYSSTGVSTQMPVSPAIPHPAAGSDSIMVQTRGPSPQFNPHPVPLQAVNPPIMPLPQSLTPYQDPLYPGFPLDENGERATAPPYSLCKSGDDLPKDKSVLQFFFNLGVKAYSCPMWAPHSYLYPLHQAHLNICRMYPKIPVYPHNSWFQEVVSTENEHASHANRHSPMQNEARLNGPCAPGGTATSPPPPWFVSTGPVFGNTGQAPNLCGVETESIVQPPPPVYADSMGNKSIYPQPVLGHSSFLSPVPLAHSYYPPVWYGYPMQGFIESPTVQHNVAPTAAESNLIKEYSDSTEAQNCVEQFQETGDVHNHSAQQALVTNVSSELLRNGKQIQASKAVQMHTTAPSPPKKAGTLDFSIEAKETERQIVAPSPPQADSELCELTNPAVPSSEKTDMARDAHAPVSLPNTVPQTRPHRTREESSEDEREVSDMLRSGRSKNFYNQTYGARKYRSDRGYAPSRGGFHYPRNEEGWKGQSSRSREDGYQSHRGFRGRPYKSDNRRRPTGDLYRGHQEHEAHGPYQKPN